MFDPHDVDGTTAVLDPDSLSEFGHERDVLCTVFDMPARTDGGRCRLCGCTQHDDLW